jgi:CxxC-x17-CxxC domain-containing protein
VNLQEKTIACFDCGLTFTFSVEEQLAYQTEGRFNAPKRCPACRQTRKARQMKSSTFRNPQTGLQLFPVTCAQCGKSTQVPFEPKSGRPVYCRDCYQAVRRSP